MKLSGAIYSSLRAPRGIDAAPRTVFKPDVQGVAAALGCGLSSQRHNIATVVGGRQRLDRFPRRVAPPACSRTALA